MYNKSMLIDKTLDKAYDLLIYIYILNFNK